MDTLKRLVILSLCMSMVAFVAACDVDDDGGDAGLDGGAETGPGEGAVYTWVIIEDTSDEENIHGTPGVDICGVSFSCPGGVSGHGMEAEVTVAGAGSVCVEADSDCSASRDLPEAAVGVPENPCVAISAPSHYVSIGVGGILAIRLGVGADDGTLIDSGGLTDCDVTVVELAGGSVPESYKVNTCVAKDAIDCATHIEEVLPRPGDSHTDSHTFTVIDEGDTEGEGDVEGDVE